MQKISRWFRKDKDRWILWIWIWRTFKILRTVGEFLISMFCPRLLRPRRPQWKPYTTMIWKARGRGAPLIPGLSIVLCWNQPIPKIHHKPRSLQADFIRRRTSHHQRQLLPSCTLARNQFRKWLCQCIILKKITSKNRELHSLHCMPLMKKLYQTSAWQIYRKQLFRLIT